MSTQGQPCHCTKVISTGLEHWVVVSGTASVMPRRSIVDVGDEWVRIYPCGAKAPSGGNETDAPLASIGGANGKLFGRR